MAVEFKLKVGTTAANVAVVPAPTAYDKHGGFTEAEIKSESKTKSGYATANPLTAYERSILKNIRTTLTQRESSIIEFNKAINAGTALYSTTQNGKTYYHDKPELTESSYIMIVNSAGVAWTDEGWHSTLLLPNTVWKYGYTCDGNAILNSLDTYKLNAELITVNDLRAFGATIGGWHINQNSMYADVGRYRAFVQSASSQSVTDAGESWIFSTQELVSGNYEGRFFVTAKGVVFAQRLESAGCVKTGTDTDSFDSVIHTRTVNGTLYEGKFGIGSVQNKGTAALELRQNNKTAARLDVMQGNYSADTVILRTNTTNPSSYTRYICVGSNAVYFQKSYGAYSASTAMLNLYCNDILFQSNGSTYSMKACFEAISGFSLNSVESSNIEIDEDEELEGGD